MVFTTQLHEPATGVQVSHHPEHPLLPPFPVHPSGLSQRTSFECPAPCIELALVIYFTYGNIHVSMLFSRIIPPSPSPTEPKSLFFTAVSLLLSRIQGRHYCLSKFHICELICFTGIPLYICTTFSLSIHLSVGL